MILLECQDVCKTYGQGDLREDVLKGVSLRLARGETCVLLGPSGSGKTTLLAILGCLLSPTSGELRIDGKPIREDGQARLAQIRRRRMGFVFQQAQLLPFLTVEENIAHVAHNAGLGRAAAARRGRELLVRLDIDRLREKKPDQLSGGQRQRVAVARAVVHRPPVLLADEPTAALDWENGEAVVRLLIEQAKAEAALLVVVTHDTRLVSRFDRTLHMEAGKVIER
jgi:putative ABC transport system ATP-binding protein